MGHTEESYAKYVNRKANERCMKMVARVMKACGVTQVDISAVDLRDDDIIAIEDHFDFLRIKGTFVLDAAPVDGVGEVKP